MKSIRDKSLGVFVPVMIYFAVFRINFIKSNTYLSVPECLTLCADLGLWKAISTISFGKGMVWCSFQALLYRFTSPCRGLWATLLKKQYAPFIVTEPAIQMLKYIEQYCETFDNLLLKVSNQLFLFYCNYFLISF